MSKSLLWRGKWNIYIEKNKLIFHQHLFYREQDCFILWKTRQCFSQCQQSDNYFNACDFLPNRREVQMSQLSKLEAPFSTSRAELGHVQERIKSLGIAMQMAREVLRVPILGQYCTLDKVWNVCLLYIHTETSLWAHNAQPHTMS